MENSFNGNHFLSIIEIKHTIFSKLQQSKAVLTCIMFALEFIRSDMMFENATLYNALWAVDGYLEDLTLLFEQLEKWVTLQ